MGLNTAILMIMVMLIAPWNLGLSILWWIERYSFGRPTVFCQGCGEVSHLNNCVSWLWVWIAHFFFPSEEQSRLAARKYARVVQKLGFPAKFLDFKIQNMVGSCDVKFPIRLEPLVLSHQQFASYEPELFPGLIYRMIKPRIVLLIFVSGKVVLTGKL